MAGSPNNNGKQPFAWGPVITVLISGGFMGIVIAGFKTIYEKLVLSDLETQIENLNDQAKLLAQNPGLNLSQNNIAIPVWVDVISILLYILVSAIILVFVLWLYPKHYNNTHNCPDICNSKLNEQAAQVVSVDSLLSHVRKMKDYYLKQVAKNLRDNDEIADIEGKAQLGHDIFIMTSSFLLERFNPEIKTAIISNINRGCRYKYIIPDTTEKLTEFREMVYTIFYGLDDNLYLSSEK